MSFSKRLGILVRRPLGQYHWEAVKIHSALEPRASDNIRQTGTGGHETLLAIETGTGVPCSIVHRIYMLERRSCHVQVWSQDMLMLAESRIHWIGVA